MLIVNLDVMLAKLKMSCLLYTSTQLYPRKSFMHIHYYTRS